MSWSTRAPPSAGKVLMRFRKPREGLQPFSVVPTRPSCRRGRPGQLGCHWLSFGRCNGRRWTKAILGARQWTTSPGFEDRGSAIRQRP
jgi:hypothetical protein